VTDELQKTASGALMRPSFIPQGDTRGTEDITRDEMNIPRLAIAQQTSPEVLPEGERSIPGLAFLSMFNTVTKEIYGRGPIEFAVLRRDPPRWVQFAPIAEGGGLIDPNVPVGDPRTLFRTGPDGKRLAPVATQFWDYFILLLSVSGKKMADLNGNLMDHLVGLSLKSTQIKVAKQLNTLIKMRSAPLFAGKYVLTTIMETNASKQNYGNFKVANASAKDASGKEVAAWTPTSAEEFETLSRFYESLKEKDVKVAPETTAEPGDTDFPHGANVGDSPDM